MVVATEDGGVVGTAAAFEMHLTLPGSTTAPAAGVTYVGVRPTHHRRGILTSVMRHQLADVRERGEALAVLLASESIIYGRFGYGLATMQADYVLERRHAQLASPFVDAGRLRILDEAETQKVLPEAYDRVRAQRAGEVSRPQGWWDDFFRKAKAGSGFGPRFTVVHEDAGGSVDGFACYRIGNRDSAPMTSDWSVLVQQMGALSAEAYAALWRYLWEVDLTDRVLAPMRPVDEPLRHLLADPRRLQTSRAYDFLWCRVVDVGAALAARRYEVDQAGSVVLEVRDPVCPWNEGRWRLDVDATGAGSCQQTDASADLTLSATELGAAYLGGTRLAVLAGAGRVDEHADGAVARADRLLATARQPWSSTEF
jgi:predicted acetyltransferase